MSGLILLAILVIQPPAPRTTMVPDLQRAQQHGRTAWIRHDARDFEGAVREFEAALQIYADYADALYGLGKARMALRQYDGAARAFERARDSYAHAGTQDAERRLLANRAREDQVRNLRQRLAMMDSAAAVAGPGAGTAPSTEALNIRQQIRELRGDRESGPATGTPSVVPAFISLSLGSAYFRLERLAEAEREFRAAIAVEPKFGEALSNLALVCLLTGRAAEAQDHVRVAEEAKFKVNPELKRRIRDALGK
jgi:tetratricopeptide (TPR) repeat protein